MQYSLWYGTGALFETMKTHLQTLYQWIITRPSLFAGNGAENAPFYDFSGAQVSVAPESLHYQGNPRLGFIYQHLCAEVLQHSPRYKLCGEELQLNSQGRTLGAIDFIVQDKASGQFEHWEVAIKFYLLHQQKWYGPDPKDRLDKKLAHMLNHQLAMSDTQIYRQKYPHWPVTSRRLVMQGRLYTNPFTPEPVPDNCLGYKLNSQQIEGHWCYFSQIEQVTEPLYCLDKAHWITGNPSLQQAPQINEQQRCYHCQTPSGVFWFLVADNWPEAQQ